MILALSGRRCSCSFCSVCVRFDSIRFTAHPLVFALRSNEAQQTKTNQNEAKQSKANHPRVVPFRPPSVPRCAGSVRLCLLRRACQGGGGAVGRIDDPSLLAHAAAGGGGTGNGIGLGDPPVEVPVHLQDLELAALSVATGNVVVPGKLLEDGTELRVLGPRHGGEQVVFQLVLHATPEPFRKRVRGDGVAGRLELRRDPIGLVVLEHFFRLVRGGDDQGADETGHEDGGQPDLHGEEGPQNGVVDEERVEAGFRSGPLFTDAGDGDLHRVHPPEGEQEAKGDVEDQVLDLAEGAVVFRRGGPLEQKRVGGNVLVASLFVGERVVLVVFVRPPDGKEPRREGRKVPQLVGKGIDAVDVVVPEPPGRGHAQPQQDRRERREGLGGQRRDRHEPPPDAQQLALVGDVALPPAVGLELVAELPEGDLRGAVGDGGGLQQRGGLRLAPGEALVHRAALFGVKGVHDLGGVAAVVPVDPVFAGGVGLSPAREVVPLSVDAHVEGGPAAVVVAFRNPLALGVVVALPGPAEGVVGFVADRLGLPAAAGGGGVLERGGDPRGRGRSRSGRRRDERSRRPAGRRHEGTRGGGEGGGNGNGGGDPRSSRTEVLRGGIRDLHGRVVLVFGLVLLFGLVCVCSSSRVFSVFYVGGPECIVVVDLCIVVDLCVVCMVCMVCIVGARPVGCS
mmetsp:Transcript_4683/g.10021  ORF Transcript_4683/g.10021 Transcript_4683/m.10021 type:complete len:679 (+) Transcript_4683:140-2176(+)